MRKNGESKGFTQEEKDAMPMRNAAIDKLNSLVREQKIECYEEHYFSRFKNGEIKVEKSDTLKFTLNVKTTWIYPGYTLAAVEPAKISAVLTFFETQNPENILFQVEYEKVIGITKELTYNQGTLGAGEFKITDVTGVTVADTTPSTSTIDVTSFSGNSAIGIASISFKDFEGTLGTQEVKFRQLNK